MPDDHHDLPKKFESFSRRDYKPDAYLRRLERPVTPSEQYPALTPGGGRITRRLPPVQSRSRSPGPLDMLGAAASLSRDAPSVAHDASGPVADANFKRASAAPARVDDRAKAAQLAKKISLKTKLKDQFRKRSRSSDLER